MSQRLVPLPEIAENDRPGMCSPCHDHDKRIVSPVVALVASFPDHSYMVSGLCANHAEVFEEEPDINQEEIEQAVRDVGKFSNFL